MDIIHGDVVLKKIDALPSGLITPPKDMRGSAHTTGWRDDGKYTIRHGESGHQHVIDADATKVEILWDPTSSLHYLNVKDTLTISHEEHKTLTIVPGFYQEGSENEYNPFEKMVRKVQD